jgi:hypothetical protein
MTPYYKNDRVGLVDSSGRLSQLDMFQSVGTYLFETHKRCEAKCLALKYNVSSSGRLARADSELLDGIDVRRPRRRPVCGGSAGGTDHTSVRLIAKKAKIKPGKVSLSVTSV